MSQEDAPTPLPGARTCPPTTHRPADAASRPSPTEPRSRAGSQSSPPDRARLRHGHKTWMVEDGIPEILAEQRLGRELPAERRVHIRRQWLPERPPIEVCHAPDTASPHKYALRLLYGIRCHAALRYVDHRASAASLATRTASPT
jgi:hypothetical protein